MHSISVPGRRNADAQVFVREQSHEHGGVAFEFENNELQVHRSSTERGRKTRWLLYHRGVHPTNSVRTCRKSKHLRKVTCFIRIAVSSRDATASIRLLRRRQFKL